MVLVLMVMVGIVGGVYLAQLNQETRRGAAGGTTAVFSVNMGYTTNPKVGDTFPATITLNMGDDQLTYFQTRLLIGQTDVLTAEKVELQSYTVDGQSYDFEMPTAKYENGMIKIGGSLNSAKIPSGAVLLAKVTFRAKKVGTASLTMDEEITSVQGKSAAGAAVELTATLNSPAVTVVANTAFDGMMDVRFEPASLNLNVGESTMVTIKGDSPTYGVVGADFYLQYDKEKTELRNLVVDAAYNGSASVINNTDGTLRISMTWKATADPVPGTFEIAKVVLVAKKEATESFSISGSPDISGVGPVTDRTNKTLGLTISSNVFTYNPAGVAVDCSTLTTLANCDGQSAVCAWYSCSNKCFPKGTDVSVACPGMVCTDSDGGKVYETKGETCLGTTDCVSDSCNVAKTVVTENYCEAGVKRNETHICGSGKECVNGACVVKEEAANGTDPVLDIKMAFYGLRKNLTCKDSLQLQLIVKGNGESKVYGNVTPVATGVTNPVTGDVVYQVKKLLTGFGQEDNVAVFLRAFKYVQNKYGVNNQIEFFNEETGRLTLKKDYETSTKYDFSSYPLLPGDVNNDGKINGIDFALVKEDNIKLMSLEKLTGVVGAVGGTIPNNLDGDCVVSGHDLSILRNSLSEKQSQLY